MLAGCVDVDAHLVHAHLYGLVERMFQLFLIHILLVLSHADGAGVYLHQFGKWIHESATDADGTTYGHVVVGEFVSCHFRGRVDAGTIFAHHKDLDLLGQTEGAHECFRFATGGTVADGDGFNLVLRGQRPKLVGCCTPFVLGRVGVDGFVVQQISFGIEAHDLAARSKSWVERQHTFLSERWRHEQLLEVFHENADGFLVGEFFR